MAVADAFIEINVDDRALSRSVQDAVAGAIAGARGSVNRAGQQIGQDLSASLGNPFKVITTNSAQAAASMAGSFSSAAQTVSRDLGGMASATTFQPLVAGATAAGSAMVSILGSAAHSTATIINQTLSGAFVGLTTAGALLGTALVHTGVEYNNLVQKSGAAFSTILGSVQASRDMLAQLTEFARSSPFPRQVFIQASQQLLGFGLNAQKLIPLLQAIEDAVAATGGGAEDILSISNAFAQVQGTGRITGDLLQQLGMRGINAAELIGKAMGKTADQIRNDISKGTIPAGVAMDALVTGMETRFAGGANAIKQQFVGAVDRIKGAFRDISSAIVEPFISVQGGGMAVVWSNQFADALRSIERNVIPALIGPITAIGNLIGTWVTKVTDFMKTLSGSQATAFVGWLKEILPLLGLAGGAFAAMGANALHAIPIIGQFLPQMNRTTAAIAGLALASPAVRQAFSGLLDAIGPAITELERAFAPILRQLSPLIVTLSTALTSALVPVLNTVAGVLSALGPALGDLLSVLGQVIQAGLIPLLGTVGSVLASLGPPLIALFSALAPVITALGNAITLIAPPIGDLVAVLITALGAGLTPLFEGLAVVVDALAPTFALMVRALTEVAAAIAPVLPLVGQFIARAAEILASGYVIFWQGLAAAFVRVGEALAPVIPVLGDALMSILDALAPVLPALGLAMANLAVAFAELLVSLVPLIPPLTQLIVLLVDDIGAPTLLALANAFVAITAALDPLAPLLAAVAATWLAFKIQMLASQAVMFTMTTLLPALGTAIEGVGLAIDFVAAGGLGVILVGVIALGAAAFVAYQKFQPFHDIVDAVGRVLGGAITTAATFLGDQLHYVSTAFDAVRDAIATAIGFVERFRVPFLVLASAALPIVGAIALLVLAFQHLDGVVGFIETAFDTIVGVVTAAYDIFDRFRTPILLVGAALVPIVAPILALVFAFQHLSDIVEIAGEVFSTVVDVILAQLAPLQDIASLLVDLFTNPIETLQELPARIFGIVQDMVGAFTALPVGVLRVLADLASRLAPLPGIILDFLVDGFSTVGAFVLDQLGKLPGLVVSGLGALASVLPGVFEAAFTGVLTVLRLALIQIPFFFLTLPRRIVDALVGLAPTMLDLFVRAVGAVVDFLGNVGPLLLDGIQAGIGAVVDFLGDLGPTLVGLFETAFGAVLDFLTGLGSSIGSGITGAVSAAVEAVPGALAALGPLLLSAFDLAVQGVLTFLRVTLVQIPLFFLSLPFRIFGALRDFGPGLLGTFVNAFLAVVDWLVGTVPGLLFNAAEAVTGGFFSWFVDMGPTIFGFFEDAFFAVVDWVVGFAPTLAGAFVDLITGAVTAIPGILAAIVDFFVHLPGQIIGALVGLDVLLVGAINRAMALARDAAAAAIEGIIGFFVDLPGRIVGAVSDLGALAVRIAQFFTELPGRIGDVAGTLAGLGVQVLEGLLNGIVSAATTIGPFLLEHVIQPILDEFARLPQTITESIGPDMAGLPAMIVGLIGDLGGAFLDFIQAAWSGLWNTFTTGWANELAFWTNLPSTIIDLAGDLGSAFLDFVSAAWSFLWDQFTTAWAAELDFWSSLPATIIGLIGDLGQAFLDFVSTAWSWLWQTFPTVWAAELAFWTSLPGTIIGIIGDLGSAFLGFVTGAWSFLWQTFQTVWANELAFWSGLPGMIFDAVGDLGSALWGFFTTAFDVAKTSFTTFGTDVINFFTGIPAWIGGGLATLADAITSPFQTAFNFIADLWNNTIGSLHIHTPDIPGLGSLDWDAPTIPKWGQKAPAGGGGGLSLRMATGGLVNLPTVAMLGEAGKELVLPLTNTARTLDLMRRHVPADTMAAAQGGGQAGPVIGNVTLVSPSTAEDIPTMVRALRAYQQVLGK